MDSLWLDLLNSDWHDYLGTGRREDRLENPEWLSGFLARWGLSRRDISSSDTRGTLRRLRSLLQRLVATVGQGRPPASKDLAALNSFLAATSVVRRLERDHDAYRLLLVPVEGKVKVVLSDIANSFAEVLVQGDLGRIKVCENPHCKWVFYDRSRNRTRRWCEGPVCGNLLKVRRFRQRRRKGGKGPRTQE